jgi:hypothetical protein
MKVKFIFTVSVADNPEAPSGLIWTAYQKIIGLPNHVLPRTGERVVVTGRSIVVCPRVKDVEWNIFVPFDSNACSSHDVVIFMSTDRPIISAEKTAIEEAGFEVMPS